MIEARCSLRWSGRRKAQRFGDEGLHRVEYACAPAAAGKVDATEIGRSRQDIDTGPDTDPGPHLTDGLADLVAIRITVIGTPQDEPEPVLISRLAKKPLDCH